MSYSAELVGALAVVLAVVVPSALLWNTSRRTPHGGLITGTDNRISTSKTIALAWTMVVAWMVVAEAFIAAFPSKPPGTFSGLLGKGSDLYFVFLGGPFAAAAFAKASVQTKMAQGKLTKTPADAPSSSDLISDDNGNPDLYDFQYVLFNILALLIVTVTFWVHPEMGPPAIPDFLAILTGGSALTYTVNKAIATDTPQINSVTPANARIGDVITITGVQMFSTTAGGAFPSVTIGGIGATGVTVPTGSTTTLMATVADAPSGMSLGGAQDVVVSPPLASPITARNAITIVADKPAITTVAKQPVKANGKAGYRLGRTLIEHDLADELRLVIFPVVLGAGERLFGQTSHKKPMRLVDTKTIGDGLVFLGTSTAGGYTVGYVTGSAGSHDRVDTLENTLRDCLGLRPLPTATDPPARSGGGLAPTMGCHAGEPDEP